MTGVLKMVAGLSSPTPTQLVAKRNQQCDQLNDIGEWLGIIERGAKRSQIPCTLAGNIQASPGRGKTTASTLVIARNVLLEAR